MKKLSPKFSENLWRKIKSQDIPQIPAWVFPLREGVFWFTYIASIFFGGVLLAVLYTFYQTLNTSEIFTVGMETSLEFHAWTEILPIAWGVLFIIAALLSLLSFTKTSNGYKFPKVWLLLFNVLLTIIVAVISLWAPFVSDFITQASEKLEIEKEIDRGYFHHHTITPDGKYELIKGTITSIDIEKKVLTLKQESKETRLVYLAPYLFTKIIKNTDDYLLKYEEFIGENLEDGTFKALYNNKKPRKREKKHKRESSYQLDAQNILETSDLEVPLSIE